MRSMGQACMAAKYGLQLAGADLCILHQLLRFRRPYSIWGNTSAAGNCHGWCCGGAEG